MARKPSIRIIDTKNGLQIIKTTYNDLGKAIGKTLDIVPKKKR